MAISVVLVDDHAVVREAVAGMLDSQDDISVVGQAGSLVRRPGPLRTASSPLPRRARSSRSST